MNKKEAIKEIKKASERFYACDYIKTTVAESITSQIHEPQKVVVPKFVAERIEKHKGRYKKWDEEARADFVLRYINDLFRFGEGLNPWYFNIDEKFSEWANKSAYEFIIAILFGYEVETEKLYTVRIPNPNRISFPYALYRKNDGKIIIIGASDNFEEKEEYQLTEAEIKQDFEWAWQFALEVE
jgi:hypothetical protein